MEEIKLEFGSEAPAVIHTPAAPTLPEDETALDFSRLSAEEQAQIRDFVSKINIEDNNAIVTYGGAAQKKVADFSDNVLKSVRTKDMGETGKLLGSLVNEISNFDADASEKKGIRGFISNTKKSFDKLVVNYSKVETNIDKITNALEGHRRVLLKDIALYDSMYENNRNYFKELNMYIIAGKEKLKEANEQIIPALRAKAEETKSELDAQKLNDVQNAVNRFDKKIHDLQLSRTISLQMAPQIRLIQNNDAVLVDKIQSSIVNAIPLWKNQMVIALGLSNANKALEAQKKVTQMTNDLLKKNSEMLKQGTIEIAKESEKGIVELETIQKTNRDLIETIQSVLEIQKKGSEDRRNAEQELVKIETELKQALLDSVKK